MEAEHKLEGKSLVPLVAGDGEALHEAVFTEQTYHGDLEPLRAVRTERYKYVRRHFETGTPDAARRTDLAFDGVLRLV